MALKEGSSQGISYLQSDAHGLITQLAIKALHQVKSPVGFLLQAASTQVKFTKRGVQIEQGIYFV
jgi:hypothetical protein